MRQLLASRELVIPEGVKVEVKARKVRVTGPRGQLQREFKYAAVDMYLVEEDGQKKLKVEMTYGRRKNLAVIRTISSHIQNMINGVTKGFEYKMRLVYAHFPINVNIENNGTIIELRNFLGEKIVRRTVALPGVKIERSATVKDELILSGNDIENVSKTCSLIYMQCLVKKKDIRKFLDGVYVSDKGFVVKE